MSWPIALLSEHEVEYELLTPQDDALDNVERKHAETVEDIDTLFEQWDMSSLILAHLCLLCLMHDLTELADLRKARLTGNDRPDGALDG